MTTDTIVSEAAPAAAPAVADAPAAAAPTVDTTITGAPDAAPAPAAVVQTPEQIAAAEAVTAAEAAAEAAKAEGAPEKYADFVAPEGSELDTVVVGAFADAARELNLSQTKAQLLIDKVSPILAQRQMEQFQQQRQAWHDESAADPEFGGVKFDESKVLVARAMKEFATPAFTALINESGFGNHPELVRFMVKAGRALTEEKMIVGGIPASTGTRSAADVLYPAQAKQK